MKKLLMKVATAATLVLSTAVAWAVPVGGGTTYTPVQTSGQYSAYVTFHGTQSPEFSQNMFDNTALLTQFVNSLNNAYQAVPNTMASKLSAYAAQQNATLNSLAQDGSISASLVGTGGGNVQMTLSGLSYFFTFTAQKSYSIVNVSCTTTVSVMGVTLTSNYNAFSGAVTGTNATYTPSQVTNCDNSLSWIPFLGDFINNKAQNLVGGSIQTALNAYNGQIFPVNPQTAIFGFANAIQPGVYKVNSVDVGMYIKNNLTNLLSGKSVTVYIATPNNYFPAGTYKSPGPASTSAPAFIITMADGSSSVSFGVIASGTYTWEKS